MDLNIKTKKFCFSLSKDLKTSQGILKNKEGWLIRITSNDGKIGWGEVSPIEEKELSKCKRILSEINPHANREELEENIKLLPKSLGFGLGSALAEIDSEIGEGSKEGWLKTNKSALLLTLNNSTIDYINNLLYNKKGITLKLKVGLNSDKKEKELIEEILKYMPDDSKLRLDPNGAWEFNQAEDWAYKLKDNPKIEWIEQPINAEDIPGLIKLSKIISIALDESLIANPSLIELWDGWQIRRPSIEGDPRSILKEFRKGVKFRAISTTFETGIGKRWIEHLAALQIKGPTPTDPGLAPGWLPKSNLFSNCPELVWQSA